MTSITSILRGKFLPPLVTGFEWPAWCTTLTRVAFQLIIPHLQQTQQLYSIIPGRCAFLAASFSLSLLGSALLLPLFHFFASSKKIARSIRKCKWIHPMIVLMRSAGYESFHRMLLVLLRREELHWLYNGDCCTCCKEVEVNVNILVLTTLALVCQHYIMYFQRYCKLIRSSCTWWPSLPVPCVISSHGARISRSHLSSCHVSSVPSCPICQDVNNS